MAFIEPMHRNKPNITYLLVCIYGTVYCEQKYTAVVVEVGVVCIYGVICIKVLYVYMGQPMFTVSRKNTAAVVEVGVVC